jgi:hypothetical protein
MKTPERAGYDNARARCAGNHQNYGGRGIKFLFTAFGQLLQEPGSRQPVTVARPEAIPILIKRYEEPAPLKPL